VEIFFTTSTDPAYPFILFGWSHILLILWVTFTGWFFIRKGLGADERTQRNIRWLFFGVFLFWEIEWQAWYIIVGEWSLDHMLPLHMCSVMTYVSMYGLLTRAKWTFPLMYFFGIAGAIQAIITPDAIYAFPHFRFMNTMFTHSLLVISGLWVFFVEGYRPTLKDLRNCFIMVHIYAVPVYFINLAIGSRYMYLGKKPATASLLDVFPEWPWYFFILQALLLLIMVGMYLPFRKLETQPVAAA